MSAPFRRRLGKRHAQPYLKDVTKIHGTNKDAGHQVKTTGSDAQIPLSDDDSPPPPPPKATLDSTIRRVSPSHSLLDRYKQRAPAATAPSVTPDMESEMAASAAEVDVGRRLTSTSFSKIFGDLDSSDSTVAPTVVTADDKPRRVTSFSEIFDSPNVEVVSSSSIADSEQADSVPFARGEHFATTRVTRAPLEREDDMETVRTRDFASDEEAASRRRSTRSQTRRQERADSAAEGLVQEDVKDVKNNISSPALPPALNIRKHCNEASTDNGTPSPDAEAEDENAVTTNGKTNGTPFNSPCLEAEDQDELADPVPIPSPKSAASSTSSNSISLDENRPLTKSLIDQGSKIGVNPPEFDPTYSNLHQWCDHRAFTSRPEQPWAWMKRWTCCRCSASTIVEQEVCAKIACGHLRCKRNCKLLQSH